MDTISKRVVVLVTSLLLALGVVAALPAAPATAATSCTAQDQRVGQTQVRAKQAATARKKAATRVKKAKKAYAKRDTTVNKKKLAKARKSQKKAVRRLKAARASYAGARGAAQQCHAVVAAEQADAQQVNNFLSTLPQAGFSPSQIQQVAAQIAEALAGGDVSPDVLLALLRPVVDQLTAAGLPVDQVAGALEEVLGTLAQGNVPSSPTGLVNLVVDSVQDALADTPINVLNPILEQVQGGLNLVLGGLLGGLPLPLP